MSTTSRPFFLIAVALLLLVCGLLSGDWRRAADVMTYGNFDFAPSEGQSGIMYLAPGTPDLAIRKVYEFGRGILWHPLVALSTLFAIVLFWRRFRDPDSAAGSRRWLVQWLGFVGTRVGMLRTGQVLPVQRCTLGVLPVLNCQTCEMANGACPIAAIQASLRHQDIPMLAVGVVTAAGLAAGRWFCGWLCPFGLIEDLLDRLSRDRLRLPRRLEYGRFVMLGLVVLVPIGLGLAGVVQIFPFCSTVCPSGMILGLAPYYLTTGKPAVAAILSAPAAQPGAFAVVAGHLAGLVAYLGLALNVKGRFFCRYLCPLGAFLGLFNRVSLVRIENDPTGCGECRACVGGCPTGSAGPVDDFLAASGCIRCGRCVRACPSGNRQWTVGWGGRTEVKHVRN
ncbi:MAG: 4Fe-4S binding protein [Deltaproteobacteria bacterium]|nr:4Fe-4S binding protein [Deltaproteobacteria bacterium]